MKKTKVFSPITWFDHNNRRHVVFLIAVSLIGILFVATLIGILTGRYKPFADIVGDTHTRLNNEVTLRGGGLSYTLPDGSTKTAEPSPQSVTVQAISEGGIVLQGANLANFSSIGSKLTVHADGASPDSAVVRNLVATSDGKKSDDVVKLKVDSDTFRTKIDELNPGSSLTFVLKPDYHLAVKKTGITNMREFGTFPTSGGGDFNNDNQVNVSDLAILSHYFGETVNSENKAADANLDGVINVSDLAIMSGNFDKTGEQL